jgi:3,4-dihydroxy-2-butanone 4-phosphate synthase/GTP cyclohydrolase II
VFQVIGFEREASSGSQPIESALAIVLGDVTGPAPLLRIHSQCFTSDILSSLRCDCNSQLDKAMAAIASEERGIVIYEFQEGRGIGLIPKLQAYELQDAGLDTAEANHALGYLSDYRDYSLPIAILHNLAIHQVRLLSNNPQKSKALEEGGIQVVAEVSCEVPANPHSLDYLRTKKEKMGHRLSLEQKERDAHKGEFAADDPFASIDQAIRELEAGRMIVVVDDEDRENEGDLVMAAELITPDAVNFMATHCRGLICLAMTDQTLDRLDLSPMSPENSALHGTAFTVSIDLIADDMTTGISAADRARTIRAAADATSSPGDFARPGHVFPLRARPGGVLERRGQTEAAMDLAALAGLHPAGVICEIVNDDGTMARVPDLVRFCRKHDLVMITVADLARYRMESEGDNLFNLALLDSGCAS